MNFNILLVVVVAIELNATGSIGLITETPSNAVAEVGQQAIFNCTSDATVQNWIFSAKRDDLGTPSAQHIAINCVVQSGFTTQYEVDRPGGSNYKCNLIVKATTMQQAGVYTCSDTDRGPSAILTIDRDPSIVVTNSSGVVAEDPVAMSYTVRYNTSTASSLTPTIQPVLAWTDSDGKIVSSSNTPGTNSVTSSISLTAERQAIRPYTCDISYKINWPSPPTGLSFASNTPKSVSTPLCTPVIDISYAPIISSITTNQDVPVCPGETVKITCDASANPAPTYSWIGPDSRTYSGATVEADMNGVYSCNASNVIRGSTRSDMKETTLAVWRNDSCEAASENVVQGNSINKVAIVLGSLLAISLVINVVVLVFIIRGRSSVRKGIKMENTSNIGHQNNEGHNRNETEEPSSPSVYQELSPTRQQPTIYAQLTN